MTKQPVVFLDRDGTIIEWVDVLRDPSRIVILPGAAEAIASFNQRGFLVIVVTNQPAVEKGLITEDELKIINKAVQEKFAASGARIDAIYTCPHKFRGQGQCECRKPGQLLIERALAAFPIDKEKSWMVGDRLRDIETGKRGKMKTILVKTGGDDKSDDEFFPDAKPDYVAEDLLAAAKIIK